MKSMLTEVTWNNIEGMYDMSLIVLMKVRWILYSDSRLKTLIDSNDIIMVLKGGRAQKYAIKRAYPEASNQVDQAFGLDGDNDVAILINPKLKDFMDVHEDVKNLTFSTLRRVRDEMLTVPSQYQTTTDLSRINVNINRLISNYPSVNVTIHESYDRNTLTDQKIGTYPHEIYVTQGESHFGDNHFALVRLMKIYMSSSQGIKNVKDGTPIPVSSEILDIGIPLADDHCLSHFEQYHVGNRGYLIDRDLMGY